jgi:hypothetical protein
MENVLQYRAGVLIPEEEEEGPGLPLRNHLKLCGYDGQKAVLEG